MGKAACQIVAVMGMLALSLGGGCGPSPSTRKNKSTIPPPFTLGFGPAKIVVMPLTELVSMPETKSKQEIRTYVQLLDDFGSPIKAPGVIRFELYERVARSAEPHGKRLAIWPDFDLTVAGQNNAYWLDFIRAYEFRLDVEPYDGGTTILEATFIPPEGRRLTGQVLLPGAKGQSP